MANLKQERADLKQLRETLKLSARLLQELVGRVDFVKDMEYQEEHLTQLFCCAQDFLSTASCFLLDFGGDKRLKLLDGQDTTEIFDGDFFSGTKKGSVRNHALLYLMHQEILSLWCGLCQIPTDHAQYKEMKERMLGLLENIHHALTTFKYSERRIEDRASEVRGRLQDLGIEARLTPSGLSLDLDGESWEALKDLFSVKDLEERVEAIREGRRRADHVGHIIEMFREAFPNALCDLDKSNSGFYHKDYGRIKDWYLLSFATGDDHAVLCKAFVWYDGEQYLGCKEEWKLPGPAESYPESGMGELGVGPVMPLETLVDKIRIGIREHIAYIQQVVGGVGR